MNQSKELSSPPSEPVDWLVCFTPFRSMVFEERADDTLGFRRLEGVCLRERGAQFAHEARKRGCKQINKGWIFAYVLTAEDPAIPGRKAGDRVYYHVGAQDLDVELYG